MALPIECIGHLLPCWGGMILEIQFPTCTAVIGLEMELSRLEVTTVAEKDTAAAAKAAVGRPRAAVGRQKSRPSAAAGRRGSAAPANLFENRFSSLQRVN